MGGKRWAGGQGVPGLGAAVGTGKVSYCSVRPQCPSHGHDSGKMEPRRVPGRRWRGGRSLPPSPIAQAPPFLAWAASRRPKGQDEALLLLPHTETRCGRQGTADRVLQRQRGGARLPLPPGSICPRECPCGMEVPLARAGDPSAVAASGHGAGRGAVPRAVGSPWRRAQRRSRVPWHPGAARRSRPLSCSPTQPRWVSWPRHGVGPSRWRSHAVCQLVTVQVPFQLQEARQLHPRLAVHAPAFAPLPVQRRVTLKGGGDRFGEGHPAWHTWTHPHGLPGWGDRQLSRGLCHPHPTLLQRAPQHPKVIPTAARSCGCHGPALAHLCPLPSSAKYPHTSNPRTVTGESPSYLLGVEVAVAVAVGDGDDVQVLVRAGLRGRQPLQRPVQLTLARALCLWETGG